MVQRPLQDASATAVERRELHVKSASKRKKKGKSIVGHVWPIFFVANLIILTAGSISGKIEYFFLSIFLGSPFLFGLVFANRSGSDVLKIFALAAFISGWLAPLGFFWEREKYTYSGFSAVKDFHFSTFQYIGFYAPIIFGYFLILYIAGSSTPPRKGRHLAEIRTRVSSAIDLRLKNREISKGARSSRLVFAGTILIFGSINWWMFNNSIGMTGINPPELPFKLSGILYYLARFVFPAILIVLLTKFRPKSIDLAMLVTYACFASLTTVSKTTLFLLFMPALIAGFLNRKYYFLGIAFILLAIFYPVVSVARNFVYLVDEGLSVRNVDFSLIQVLLSSLFEYTSEDLLSGPLAIIERIGGGQDVALAAQYNSHLVAGPIAELIRLYIFDFWGLASAAQEQMYDFQPEVAGYATGDGGFFAHMLLAGSGSALMMLLVSIYLGILLAFANSTYYRLRKCGIPRELLLFYAILFCIFFFALSIPLWLNVFVVATALASRSKVLTSFVRRRQQKLVQSSLRRSHA